MRASLVFNEIKQLSDCLRLIFADDEVEVLFVGDSKQRLREDFDAVKWTGGQ